MASRFHWIRQAADHAELMDEVLPGQTVVEVIGEGRVLIEGHEGVLAYSGCRICVKVLYGVAKIDGSNLKLTTMSKNKLVITGDVSCVQLHRRSKA